jgi:hypothetical protein
MTLAEVIGVKPGCDKNVLKIPICLIDPSKCQKSGSYREIMGLCKSLTGQ